MALALVIAVFLAGIPAAAAGDSGRPVLTWYLSNFPPAFIAHGPGQGEGYGDRLFRRLLTLLPDYEHRVVDVTIVRAVHDIGHGVEACYPNAIRTPDRDALAYFTPWALVNGMRLVLSTEAAAAHADDLAEPVDLAALLRASRLRGAVNAGRSYTPEVDAVLAAHADAPMLRHLTVTPANRSDALEVLAAGRVDFTLELAARIDYVLGLAGIEPGRVELRRLAQATPWFEGHIMCPRTPWGRDRIRAIDAAVQILAADPDVGAEVERWMRPHADPAFLAASRAFYRARAAGPMHTASAPPPSAPTEPAEETR